MKTKIKNKVRCFTLDILREENIIIFNTLACEICEAI